MFPKLTTETASDVSSTCVVHALVASRQDYQRRPDSQQYTLPVVVTALKVSGGNVTAHETSPLTR